MTMVLPIDKLVFTGI